MAFGLAPRYSEEILLETFSPEQFLCLAHEAIEKTGWKISSVTSNEVIAYTDFSLGSWSEEIKITIHQDKALIKSICTGSQLMDWGKNKRNVQELVSLINGLKSTFSTDEFPVKYEKIKPGFIRHEDDGVLLSSSSKERSSGFLSLFTPVNGYFITPLLVNMNILIFIIMCISGVDVFEPDAQDLLNWGANFRTVTLDGQWWRLFTCCFLHIGLVHLLMNMYALVYIGFLLEPLLGKSKFLLAYLLTGITGSLMSIYWHDYTVSAGASGAIFGMYGVFLAMLTTNFIEKAARTTLLSSILIFVGYNLLNGIKGNIDNAAHIGGLLGGLFIGYCYYPILKNPSAKQTRNSVMTAITVIVILISAIGYVSLDNDLATFNKGLADFTKNEAIALEVYNMPENSDKKQTLKKIKYGIKLWFENVAITRKASLLDLPGQHIIQNNLLQKYCYSRINTYNYMYKTISENTDQYYPVIEDLNKNTEQIIADLKTLNN